MLFGRNSRPAAHNCRERYPNAMLPARQLKKILNLRLVFWPLCTLLPICIHTAGGMDRLHTALEPVINFRLSEYGSTCPNISSLCILCLLTFRLTFRLTCFVTLPILPSRKNFKPTAYAHCANAYNGLRFHVEYALTVFVSPRLQHPDPTSSCRV